MNAQKNKHIGKKVLYSAAIFMSALIILLSLGSIISIWLVEPPVKDTAVSLLVLVEQSAGRIRLVNSRVDRAMGELETITTDIADASSQISQNVGDKGLVMTLLPEEKEQALVERVSSAQERFNEVRDTILQILDIYHSVNRLPFVSLPGLSEQQVSQIETSIAESRERGEVLRAEIAHFRSGVSGEIDKVESAANMLTDEIVLVRVELAELDSDLSALEALAVRLQRLIPTALLTSAVILSLLFAFVIYTQVEVIRVFISRWRKLPAGTSEDMQPEEEVVLEDIETSNSGSE